MYHDGAPMAYFDRFAHILFRDWCSAFGGMGTPAAAYAFLGAGSEIYGRMQTT